MWEVILSRKAQEDLDKLQKIGLFDQVKELIMEGNMNNFTAIIKEVDDWWVGWIEEVPGVNCQEKTRDELIQSLKITLKEALEFNKQEARNEAGKDYFEEKIAI